MNGRSTASRPIPEARHLAILLQLSLLPAFLAGLIDEASARTILVPDEYPTIQEAIDAAEDGDEVLVAAGTYIENIDFLGKGISLRSAEGPDLTTIDGSELTLGEDLGSVVYFANHLNEPTIEGFTVTKGVGVAFRDLEGVLLDRHGGGIYCESASPAIIHCIIRDNENAGVSLWDSSPSFHETQILDNVSDIGGGIRASGNYTIVLTGCILDGNDASIGGGGAVFASVGGALQKSSVELLDCVVSNNSADLVDGGLAFSVPARVVRSEISGNGAAFGGGVSMVAGVLLDSRVANNEAVFAAGLELSGLGGDQSDLAVEIDNTVFESNVAFASFGAISVSRAEYHVPVQIRRCTFFDNSADETTAVGFPFGAPNASVEITDSIFWNNGDDPAEQFEAREGVIEIRYSDVEGGYDGEGNIDADPMFLDSEASDFRLDAGSPCIDAGDPESPLDADGTRADMGEGALVPASEISFVRGDVSGNGAVVALGDAIFLFKWAYAEGPAPPCMDAADTDDSSAVSALSDGLYLLRWAYSNGAAPPDPGPEGCGLDPTTDDVGCAKAYDCP